MVWWRRWRWRFPRRLIRRRNRIAIRHQNVVAIEVPVILIRSGTCVWFDGRHQHFREPTVGFRAPNLFRIATAVPDGSIGFHFGSRVLGNLRSNLSRVDLVSTVRVIGEVAIVSGQHVVSVKSRFGSVAFAVEVLRQVLIDPSSRIEHGHRQLVHQLRAQSSAA